jgi:hypothetical protein
MDSFRVDPISGQTYVFLEKYQILVKTWENQTNDVYGNAEQNVPTVCVHLIHILGKRTEQGLDDEQKTSKNEYL